MGAYKSRPVSVCAGVVDKRSRKACTVHVILCLSDEWKRNLAESYAQVLSRLKDDTTLQIEDREWSSLHQACRCTTGEMHTICGRDHLLCHCSEGKIDAVRHLARLSTVNEKSNAGLTCFHVCCIVGGVYCDEGIPRT